MDDRKNVKISASAYAALDRLVADSGMKQWAVVERYLEWLDGQSDDVKAAILQKRGDPAAVLVREKMGELAAGGALPSEVNIESAAVLAKQLIDRLEVLGRAYREELKGRVGKGKK